MKTDECYDKENEASCDEPIARAIVTVISVEGELVHVESSGEGACSRCAGSGGCGTKSLLAFFGTKSIPLILENNLGATVGDQIEIGIEHSKILKISALSYLLPLVGLSGGGALSAVLSTSDLTALVLGIAGLGIGLGVMAEQAMLEADFENALRYYRKAYQVNTDPEIGEKIRQLEGNK